MRDSITNNKQAVCFTIRLFTYPQGGVEEGKDRLMYNVHISLLEQHPSDAGVVVVFRRRNWDRVS